MKSSASTPQAVRFGAIEVDLRSGELRKHGIRLKLQEQPFRVLAMLLERPGEVVTREELRARLWPADTFVDFDHGLNSAINKLREALGDSADEPRYIETLPRRGYRFVAQLNGEISDGGTAPSDPEVVPTTSTPAPTPRGFHGPSPLAWILLASTFMAFLFGILMLANIGGMRDKVFAKWADAGPASPIRSLAVLPLENLSNDAEQEFFADGMTDQLITDLAQISALRVISRTSAFQYKGVRKKSLPQIAKELGVDAVVDGAVLRSGDRVRITAELVDARTDQHLWAKDYERDLRDVLLLQSEVASAIAGEIHAQLTPQVKQRLANVRPVNAEAYQAYLRGQYFLRKRTIEAEKKALDYFNQVIVKDPAYAPAYAGIGTSYGLLAFYGGLSPRESHRFQREAALKSLELDPALPEAHIEAGFASSSEWNWGEAENEFRRAIELSPSSSDAHHAYSLLLSDLRRFDEALAENKREQELDPVWAGAPSTGGWICYYARQYEHGVLLERKALDLDPNFAPAHWSLGLLYQQQGRIPEAMAEFQLGLKLSPDSPIVQAMLGHTYAVAGRTAGAERVLRTLEQRSNEAYVSPFNVAAIYAGLGRKQDTLAWLSKAFDEHDPWLSRLADPRFDLVRSDPRFSAIRKQMHLPQ